ncbi:hypothetical protein SDC9_80211 [bioreactor metagenome]|uniref:Uncharacterized protein n=1 Tax=bioreactor metagenome TaxID=1076179 RepID=A0A644Z6B7_9ZZZZ
MELLLIIGHHAGNPVFMEASGDLAESIAGLGELKEGEFKQIGIIGFKVDLSSPPQHAAVGAQEALGGEPAPGVLMGGPGVAEINVNQINFVGRKVLRQPRRVTVHKKDVPKAHGRGPLHGDDHGVGHPLHRHEQCFRVRRGRFAGKAALAAADFQPQAGRAGHQAAPVASPCSGVAHQQTGAAFHTDGQVLFLSHAHGVWVTPVVCKVLPCRGREYFNKSFGVCHYLFHGEGSPRTRRSSGFGGCLGKRSGAGEGAGAVSALKSRCPAGRRTVPCRAYPWTACG